MLTKRLWLLKDSAAIILFSIYAAFFDISSNQKNLHPFFE